ncbi:MAG: hypothetical protein HQL33_02575 [Alphaproteobacteria bacterium]|nr:hypothetical protein [Alphaproteobacteria bacterium]
MSGVTLVSVNEASLAGFIMAVLARRRVIVIGVAPVLPALGRPLRWVVDRVLAAGRASPVLDLCPEMDAYARNPNALSVRDIFADIEPWQNRRFGFDAADATVPRYAMAYKQVTGKHLQDKYLPMLLCEAAVRRLEGGDVRVIGLDADALALHQAYFGAPLPGASAPRASHGLVNAVLAVAVAVASLVWLGTRTRLRRRKPEPIFLAADFLRDPRDRAIYDLAREGGPVLLVMREKGMTTDGIAGLEGHGRCNGDDGRVGLVDALRCAGDVFREGASLYRAYRRLQPAHYYQIATLPHRRLKLRAFFFRFRPKYYWNRDEYNVEHILRRTELHAVGGISLGLMHGIQGMADLNPRRRYISFDVFYIFGDHLYNLYYKETWPEDMKVRAVGSFTFSRAQLAGPRPAADSDLIVIFAALGIGNPEFPRLVRAIAEAFPHYRVRLKPKGSAEVPAIRAFLESCREGLDNVEAVATDATDLIGAARYVLSDPSTVVAEAVYFGVPTLVIDIIPGHRRCLFRDFPGLCVTSAEQAVDRLRDMDSGVWTQPRAAYDSLVKLDGPHFLEIVRGDLGLGTEGALDV